MAVACQGRTDVIAMRLDMLKVGRFFDITSCQGNWSASKSFTFEEGERWIMKYLVLFFILFKSTEIKTRLTWNLWILLIGQLFSMMHYFWVGRCWIINIFSLQCCRIKRKTCHAMSRILFSFFLCVRSSHVNWQWHNLSTVRDNGRESRET